jgi:PEGA domain-containing protein
VSAHKRVLLLLVLITAAVVGGAATSEAQFRGRRVVIPRTVFVGGYYADPYWLYDPWFGYGYQYPFGPYPYPPYRYYMDPGGSVRLEVKPKEAEVYVDGYYAGVVDDFDGAFQRLHLPPGEHEIALHLDGYRGVRQKVYLLPDRTFKLTSAMERLGAGEQPDARPQPVTPPPQAGPQQPPMYPPQGRGPVGRRGPQGPPPPQGPPQGPPPMSAPRGGDASMYGSLAIRVQPADAEILIDGETWRGPGAQDRLIVDVAEGPHTVEIRKAGYRTYVTQVSVRRGESTPVNVSLRSQEQQ